jgi:hypothetical protein
MQKKITIRLKPYIDSMNTANCKKLLVIPCIVFIFCIFFTLFRKKYVNIIILTILTKIFIPIFFCNYLRPKLKMYSHKYLSLF